MKIWLKILVIGVVAIGVGCGLFWVSGYTLSRQLELPSAPESLTLTPASPVEFGQKLHGQLEMTLPRWARPMQLKVTPASGSAPVSELTCVNNLGWRHRKWQIKFDLLAVRSGAIKPGELVVELSPRSAGKAPTVWRIRIPGFDVLRPQARQLAGELQLAEEFTTPKTAQSYWHYWLAGGILVVVLLGLGLWWRRRRPAKVEIPLHIRTLNALQQLRARFAACQLEAVPAVVRLCDIVRDYLEQRYHLPLSSQTTPEFLHTLERANPLPAEQQPFLRDFLALSDLIKFARAPIDAERLEQAISSAENLVNTTKEQPANESEVSHD